jgi:antirestriction protein ArdC
VTDSQKKYIVKKILEQEGVPWIKPYCNIGFPRNYNSKRMYHGINLMLFSALNYPSPYFITAKKAFEADATIEPKKSVFAVAWIPVFEMYENEKPEEFKKRKEKKTCNYYRLYFHSLWNISQTSLWENQLNRKVEEQKLLPAEKITSKFSNRLKKTGKPCFYKKSNSIGMPPKTNFKTLEEYYSAYFHEIVHSTMIPLKRELPYETEELVAEIGAWMLCQKCGISNNQMEKNSASYISTWRSRIKDKPDILFDAITESEKAVKCIVENVT